MRQGQGARRHEGVAEIQHTRCQLRLDVDLSRVSNDVKLKERGLTAVTYPLS